jgi:hypothetical protein
MHREGAVGRLSPAEAALATARSDPPVEHQFKPGNPGRPKGSRNKLGEDFIRALAEDFAKHGPAVMEKVRTDKPDAYLKIVALLLPKDINLTVRPLDELSDDQLLARLAQLTEMAKPLLAKLEGDRDEAEPEASRH